MLTHLEMLTRITAAAALGVVIGYERAKRGRQLGLRTHMIVAMASATFMVVSSQFVFYQHYPRDSLVEVDPSRIAASVVSAVGFIAGGSILRSGAHIQGLTTAAGLWLVTAIGLCAGSGMYIEAVYATALGLLALAFLRRFEDKDEPTVPRRLTLVTTDRQDVAALTEAIRASGGSLAQLSSEQHDDGPRIVLSFDLKLNGGRGPEILLLELERRAGIRSVRIE